MKKQSTSLSTQNKTGISARITVWEIVIFPILGSIMFCSKVAMQSLPNIHLVGMFIMTYTIVFRSKALIPVYIYVFLEGVFFGFTTWWVPYLYIWTILWAVTMALPRDMSDRAARFVYPGVCCLFGLSFGTLFAPAQALFMGLDFKGMIAWIVAGLPFDAVHAAGNLVAGFLILPLSKLLKKLTRDRLGMRL